MRTGKLVTSRPPVWQLPVEYLADNVSDRIVKNVLGYHRFVKVISLSFFMVADNNLIIRKINNDDIMSIVEIHLN